MKVLHAADFHLDSAYGDLSMEQARTRRKESRELLERMVSFANQNGAELMLLAGDLLDSDNVYSDTTQVLSEILSQFQGEICIAPGNHDYYGPSSSYEKVLWPKNVHIFTLKRLERIAFENLGCVVYGNAFVSAEDSDELKLEGLPKEDAISIVLTHGDLGVKGSHYRPISMDQIEKSNADYVALGHIHLETGVRYAGTTAFAYPGCPEGRGFDETGEKGFLFGMIDKGQVQLSFVPFAKHHYAEIHVDVTGKNSIETIEKELPLDTQNDSYRIVLEGEVEESISLDSLKDSLTGRFYSLEIKDKTHLAKDVWEGLGEDSLKGLFLQKLKEQFDEATAEEEKKKILMAARYGVGAMEHKDLCY